jgi:hypothetical protein
MKAAVTIRYLQNGATSDLRVIPALSCATFLLTNFYKSCINYH